MSMRIQDRKMEEELAVAKPRSTSLNRGQLSSFGSDVSKITGDPQLDSGSVKGAAGNGRRDTVQNRVQNPETCSQVLKGDKSQRGCGKMQRCTAQGAMPDSSRGCGKLQRDFVQGNKPKSSEGCGKLQRQIENPTADDQVGLEKASKVEKRNGLILRMWSGPRLLACAGFWDGSCDRGFCGAGMLIEVFTQALGWVTIHSKCGPVPDPNSLDAEIGG